MYCNCIYVDYSNENSQITKMSRNFPVSPDPGPKVKYTEKSLRYRLQLLPCNFHTLYVSCWWWEEIFYTFWVMGSNVMVNFEVMSRILFSRFMSDLFCHALFFWQGLTKVLLGFLGFLSKLNAQVSSFSSALTLSPSTNFLTNLFSQCHIHFNHK